MKMLIVFLSLFCLGSTSLGKPKNSRRSVKQQKRTISSQRLKPQSSLLFDSKKASVARQRIQYMQQQLQGAETVGQWIDNSTHRKDKVNRRMHFSKHIKTKLPDFAFSDYAVSFTTGKNKKRNLFVLYPAKRGLVTLFNGKDISPRPKESFRNWQRRMGSLLKPRNNALLQLLVPPAHAENVNFIFAGMMSSMSNPQWEAGGFDPSRPKGQMLANSAMFLRQSNGLTCSSDGSSYLQVAYGGKGDVPIRVRPRTNPSNDRDFKVDFTKSYNSNSAQATLQFDVLGQSAKLLQEGTNRTWEGHSLIPAVTQAAYGNKPEIVPQMKSADGGDILPPNQLVSASEDLKACNALKEAGIATCDEFIGQGMSFSSCIRDNIIGAKIKNGGFLNRSPLKSLDEQQAIDLKLRLVEAYHGYGTTFRQPDKFPSTNPRGYSNATYSGETLIPDVKKGLQTAFSNGLDEENPRHKAYMNCINSVSKGSSRGCDRGQITRKNMFRFQTLEKSLHNQSKGNNLNALRDVFTQEGRKVAACQSAYANDKIIAAVIDYENLDMSIGNQKQALGHSKDIVDIAHVADISRACCMSYQCREHIEGKNRNFNTRGSKSSQ